MTIDNWLRDYVPQNEGSLGISEWNFSITFVTCRQWERFDSLVMASRVLAVKEMTAGSI